MAQSKPTNSGKKYQPQDKFELWEILEDEEVKLDEIDTSLIVDMSRLFQQRLRQSFEGIETWDVSNVTDMSFMFYYCEGFNEDLSAWDVSNVVDMCGMFCHASDFNQPLNNWNVSKVRNMGEMFAHTQFNQPLNSWDVSNVKLMYRMFAGAQSFNQPLDKWNVSKVNDMTGMFSSASSFNQNLDSWEVKPHVKTNNMFDNSRQVRPKWFHRKIENLTEREKNIILAEQEAQKSLDEEIKELREGRKKGEKYKPKSKAALEDLANDKEIKLDEIDTSLITDMSGIFASSRRRSYKGIESWDTSNVEDMHNMFSNAYYFNRDISSWNVSKVKNMSGMFKSAYRFNHPLDKWDVSNVTDMGHMFEHAYRFNQPLDKWDVSNVENMEWMFFGTKDFSQDLESWNVSKVKHMYCIFECSCMPEAKKPTWCREHEIRDKQIDEKWRKILQETSWKDKN
ncbi:BspA family leucine-rich repeat surface protein [Helicobacter sp. MIT 00-7814]|uniref:BspA family leucine-rich repeat surface protein n=1 Tax=unclassified Helicobacter TaxID=2593540 RepID=UPI000E1E84BE|nr:MULTISPECIES: BspA family leucine-rich repeat surface protein [unclassified Helicobacter]RDU55877.1 BspA family leucine-rich repeat surface protein [Helicobacter sp. MIT 00-7814]RDU56835.1 BspA family leucine-rich repeat surface protein [Helicobacter sp. MIT 99-10781]